MIGVIIRILGIALGVGLLVLMVHSLRYDPGSGVAFVLGLGLGILLGPARIAGVDFRQWLRDPGTPSEIGDDTFIGLVRSGSHVLWTAAGLLFLFLLVNTCSWSPDTCNNVDLAPYVADWPGYGIRQTAEGFAAALKAHPGIYWALKILLGMFAGLALSQLIVDGVWRLGLKFGLADPVRTAECLATQPLPQVRKKRDVPPDRRRRRLIVCCDGTWNWPESRRETNVVRIVRSLHPNDGDIAQIVHYHQGVGTGNFIDRVVGGGAGVGLTASVKACYGFLVDNYEEYDEIFIFGFSRGAFVARSLSGMIGTLGIMRKHEMDRFTDAWNWYWQDKEKRDPCIIERLAPKRYRDVDVECVGVWDTVGALGVPGSRFCSKEFAFHETSLGRHVRHAFQALAIDEARGNFQGAVWVPYNPRQETPAERCPGMPEPAPFDGDVQVLRQVWFPGVHSNIGGGYEEHGLSDSSFLWMVGQLRQHRLLAFDEGCVVRALAREDEEHYPGGVLANSRTIFWRLLGAPVPRPVCVISETERVHESVWARNEAADECVPASDLYKRARRSAWLSAMNDRAGPRLPLVAERVDFEKDIAARQRPPEPPTFDLPKKLDWCSYIMSFINRSA